MLTGRRVDPNEALRIGLVADVLDDDRLLEHALETAEMGSRHWRRGASG